MQNVAGPSTHSAFCNTQISGTLCAVGEYLFVGCGFAIAAALQPGPLQAFLFSRVTRTGWVRTLPAALSPLLSDGPIAALVLLVLVQVPPTVQALLQAAGGVLLLYLATSAYRDWRRQGGAEL